MKKLLVFLLCVFASPVFAQTMTARDEGAIVGRFREINCTGGLFACSVTNGILSLNVTATGDITDVWGCTSGNCNALTGAAGDSLDAGSADASSPATRSTSLPGTCTEGQQHQDTDSGGSELYICTATNTWTKFVAEGAVTGSGLTMATSRVLGRTTASTGAVEELTVSAPLAISAGAFSVAGYTFASTTILTSGTAATYTVPAGVRAIVVECVGGGGGGGGSDGSTSNAGFASGGSSGSWGLKSITSPAATYEYTIGTGGAGGAAGNNAGSVGGDTTFGNPAILTCNGGNFGNGSSTAGTSVLTVAGGTGISAGTGGDLNYAGGAGGSSVRLSGTIGMSGAGGASKYGGNARGVLASATGQAGTIPGSGGGGAGSVGNTDSVGGAGADGQIIIVEYK